MSKELRTEKQEERDRKVTKEMQRTWHTQYTGRIIQNRLLRSSSSALPTLQYPTSSHLSKLAMQIDFNLFTIYNYAYLLH